MKPIVTLLTDFGLQDTYVGQMKGVIAGICNEAKVIDITHEVPTQNVEYGGYMLSDAAGAFPKGTIHVAVVDPEVGSERKAIALENKAGIFVGPNNGLFTEIVQQYGMDGAVELSDESYWFGKSKTFHGRDVFAAAAAHLANGVKLENLGREINKILLLDEHKPKIHNKQLVGRLVMIDHFGNLISNVRRDLFDKWSKGYEGKLLILCGQLCVDGLNTTFADVREGEAVAYFGSSNRLEIGLRNGNAAGKFQQKIGDQFVVEKVISY